MHQLWKKSELKDIAEKVYAAERLSFEDGLRMLSSNDLPLLGHLADKKRKELHGDKVYYSVNLHLNPTNVCYLSCQICAFQRKLGEEGAYTMSLDEIESRVKRALEAHCINEVHIVGGLHPKLKLDYYLEMVGRIHAISDDLFIKGFTAVEIEHFARIEKTTYEDIILRFKAVGLQFMPGGGAEIFAEPTRGKIAKGKIGADKWLEVVRVAHKAGVPTNATMLYGHVETHEDIVDHIMRIRALQDETGGFQAFIPLTFQPENSALPEAELSDGYYDLKIFAVSRLLLDNVPHLKAYWSTLGVKTAQVALCYGVDDLAGTSIDEKVMHDAGADTPTFLTKNALTQMIQSANREPMEVNSSY